MVKVKVGIHGAHPVREVRKALERQMVGRQVAERRGAERQVVERQVVESDVERDQGGPRKEIEKPSVQRGQMLAVRP